MKRSLLFIIWCSLFSPLLGNVNIISSISEALNYVDKDTVVFFDLDNTLMRYTNQRDPSSIEPMETQTIATVKEIQEKAKHSMILTRRISPRRNIAWTIWQVRALGLDFTDTSFFDPKFTHIASAIQPSRNLFPIVQGVIFSSRGQEYYHKGPVMHNILAHIARFGYTPKKVVMIDDDWEQLASIEATLKGWGIPHTMFLYNPASAHEKTITPTIDEQLQELALSVVQDFTGGPADQETSPDVPTGADSKIQIIHPVAERPAQTRMSYKEQRRRKIAEMEIWSIEQALAPVHE